MIHRNTLSRSSFIRLGLLAFVSVLAAPFYDCVRSKNFSNPIKASRLKTLAKGFNLEHCQQHGLADGFYTKATLKQYKDLGLTYSRLPVRVSDFLDDNHPSVLKSDSLAVLDRMIEMHVRTGLGIILSPFGRSDEMYSDGTAIAKYVAFFKAFATHLSHTDPERVFLEVMNEPSVEKPQKWNEIQPKLIAAIRSGAANHTIIASANTRVDANDWNGVRAFLMTQTVEDRNVVYNFHFYDPFIFTHQGATWGWHVLQFVKSLPYPSTSKAVAPLAETIQDAEAKQAVKDYGKENWNHAKFVSVLSTVAQWAKAHRVAVTCNEFGAVPWTAPRSSRLRYLKDVREALESYGIGWGQWFELDVHDQELMRALGLTPLPPRT